MMAMRFMSTTQHYSDFSVTLHNYYFHDWTCADTTVVMLSDTALCMNITCSTSRHGRDSCISTSLLSFYLFTVMLVYLFTVMQK